MLLGILQRGYGWCDQIVLCLPRDTQTCAWASIVDQPQAKNLRKIQDAWLQLVCWYHPVSHNEGLVLDINVWVLVLARTMKSRMP